jgi:hypothetical protein
MQASKTGGAGWCGLFFSWVRFPLVTALLAAACATPPAAVVRPAEGSAPTGAAGAAAAEGNRKADITAGAPTATVACQSRLNLRIDEELRLLHAAAQKQTVRAKRSVLVDWILPRDEAEAKLLNQMAIFAMQIFARADVPAGRVGASGASEGAEKADAKNLPSVLPIQSVLHLPTDAKGNALAEKPVTRLEFIFPRSPVLEVRDTSEVVDLLGTHTQIVYGLIPLRLVLDEGLLAVRFLNPEDVLQVERLGSTMKKSPDLPKWLKQKKPTSRGLIENYKKTPDPGHVLKLLAENYCLGR